MVRILIRVDPDLVYLSGEDPDSGASGSGLSQGEDLDLVYLGGEDLDLDYLRGDPDPVYLRCEHLDLVYLRGRIRVWLDFKLLFQILKLIHGCNNRNFLS